MTNYKNHRQSELYLKCVVFTFPGLCADVLVLCAIERMMSTQTQTQVDSGQEEYWECLQCADKRAALSGKLLLHLSHQRSSKQMPAE